MPFNLYGSHPVVFITKPTACVQPNTTQVRLNTCGLCVPWLCNT